jgi:hypothetical protein
MRKRGAAAGAGGLMINHIVKNASQKAVEEQKRVDRLLNKS